MNIHLCFVHYWSRWIIDITPNLSIFFRLYFNVYIFMGSVPSKDTYIPPPSLRSGQIFMKDADLYVRSTFKCTFNICCPRDCVSRHNRRKNIDIILFSKFCIFHKNLTTSEGVGGRICISLIGKRPMKTGNIQFAKQ